MEQRCGLLNVGKLPSVITQAQRGRTREGRNYWVKMRTEGEGGKKTLQEGLVRKDRVSRCSMIGVCTTVGLCTLRRDETIRTRTKTVAPTTRLHSNGAKAKIDQKRRPRELKVGFTETRSRSWVSHKYSRNPLHKLFCWAKGATGSILPLKQEIMISTKNPKKMSSISKEDCNVSKWPW